MPSHGGPRALSGPAQSQMAAAPPPPPPHLARDPDGFLGYWCFPRRRATCPRPRSASRGPTRRGILPRMRVLLVHPSALMYSELYLRLEPLGLERVAAAVRAAGHDVRLVDLQIFSHDDYRRELAEFKPEAVGFSLNYLANVPEVIDLAKETRRRAPECFVMVGGHSGSFIAQELLEHGEGAIDCVVRGEGEVITPRVLEARGDAKLSTLPGVVTREGQGPSPTLLDDVAFIHPEQGFAIGQELERRRVRKQYYLETRCDVLIKNKELFAYWKKLGLYYMFLGLEALDEEALKLHRKRITPGENFKALEIAREIGLTVA